MDYLKIALLVLVLIDTIIIGLDEWLLWQKNRVISELKNAIKIRDNIINDLINGDISLQTRLDIQKEINSAKETFK